MPNFIKIGGGREFHWLISYGMKSYQHYTCFCDLQLALILEIQDRHHIHFITYCVLLMYRGKYKLAKHFLFTPFPNLYCINYAWWNYLISLENVLEIKHSSFTKLIGNICIRILLCNYVDCNPRTKYIYYLFFPVLISHY